jgi:nitrilase
MKAAALQMTSAIDVAANLATAARLLAQAATAGAKLAVLPENFAFMGRRETDRQAIAEQPGDGPIQTFLSTQARTLGLMIVGGTIALRVPGESRSAAACLVYRADGALQARYDKIHLFGLRRGEDRFDESATIMPGRTPVVCDLVEAQASWRIGLSVCYDLRFPEYYRALGTVDLIVVPSAFTYVTGQAHWEILLRARAIENQCYVLAPAQGGRHENGRRTWGDTMLIDPWGEVLARLPEGEGVVAGTLSAARIAEVRSQLPALAHRTL